MIRRWSLIKKFDSLIKIKPISNWKFLKWKFNSIKFLKSLIYRKQLSMISKFKRIKLSHWKRQNTWVIYTQIIKSWLWDYKLYKQFINSQHNNVIFLTNILIFNPYYVKKKNPLNESSIPYSLTNSSSKCFYYFYLNKYSNKNIFSPVKAFVNLNHFLLNIQITSINLIEEDTSHKIILFKAEKFFYENSLSNSPFHTTIINSSFLNLFLLNLKQILEIYKIIIFFYKLKI